MVKEMMEAEAGPPTRPVVGAWRYYFHKGGPGLPPGLSLIVHYDHPRPVDGVPGPPVAGWVQKDGGQYAPAMLRLWCLWPVDPAEAEAYKRHDRGPAGRIHKRL